MEALIRRLLIKYPELSPRAAKFFALLLLSETVILPDIGAKLGEVRARELAYALRRVFPEMPLHCKRGVGYFLDETYRRAMRKLLQIRRDECLQLVA
jgi:hypothetical protein